MECVLKSGAKLDVTEAPFGQALALQKAIMAAVKGLPLAADISKLDLSVLKDAVIAVATDDTVEKALFACFARATYNNIRVTEDLFNDVKLGTEARKDFYEISWKVIEVNCGPFFINAFSRLKGAFAGTPAASPA
jgi:hypothetical protein